VDKKLSSRTETARRLVRMNTVASSSYIVTVALCCIFTVPCRYCFYSVVQKCGFAPQGQHIAPIDVKFGTRERTTNPNRTTLSRKNDVMSIIKVADVSHIGF